MFCGLSLFTNPMFQVVSPRIGSMPKSFAFSALTNSTNKSTALTPYCGYPEWNGSPVNLRSNDFVPLDADTMQLSVGSPTTKYSARKSVFANAFAPHEPVSSPASSSIPKSVFPASASCLHASTMANTCPFASQEPRPLICTSASFRRGCSSPNLWPPSAT